MAGVGPNGSLHREYCPQEEQHSESREIYGLLFHLIVIECRPINENKTMTSERKGKNDRGKEGERDDERGIGMTKEEEKEEKKRGEEGKVRGEGRKQKMKK